MGTNSAVHVSSRQCLLDASRGLDNSDERVGSLSMESGGDELDAHALGVGKILGNLQSLEVALRVFLAAAEEAAGAPQPPAKALTSLEAGDVTAETALTNFDSLGVLISKYDGLVVAPCGLTPT